MSENLETILNLLGISDENKSNSFDYEEMVIIEK